MFSKEWEEEQYSKGRQINLYPFTDLISLVKKFGPGGRVLELGCGTGPNVSFFDDDGYEYHGIDGSITAIQTAMIQSVKSQNNYETGYPKFCVRDFTEPLPVEDDFFNLIVDRSSLTHNSLPDIIKTIAECHRVLRKNGVMILVDCFSTNHDEFNRGIIPEGPGTRSYVNGPLKNVGVVKFFTEVLLLNLFGDGWKVEHLVEKKREDKLNSYSIFAHFDIVARKV